MRSYLFILFIGISLFTSSVSAQNIDVQALQAFHANSPMDTVAFSSDGRFIATGGRDNLIRVWDTNSGEELMRTEGHADWVTSLAFSPDSRQIISGSRDDSVRVFDAQSGDLLRVLGIHDDDVSAVAITPDGAVIASGGRDGQIILWDSTTGEPIQNLDHFSQPVWHLGFDPTGTILASASEDGTVWLWGLWGDNAGWLKRLVGHSSPVTHFVFSEDGHYLLSGGLDGTVRSWNLSDLSVDTFSPDVTMNGHMTAVMGVAFSIDAQVGISASLDGTIRLWDISGAVALGQALSTVRHDGAPMTHLALHPDNGQVASVSTDGILNIWDTSPETITAIIESSQPIEVIAQNTPAVSNQSTNTINVETISQSSEPIVDAPVQVPALTGGRSLLVPSAGINVGVTTFYLDGVSWAIDPWEPIVGHLEGTSWVNGTGNMVLGGHSEMPDGSAGIFNNLYNVGIGDEIFVQDGDMMRRYIVVNIRSVDYRDVSVVYPTSHNRLTLITCDIPSYVAEQNIYHERLVIIADEVPL